MIKLSKALLIIAVVSVLQTPSFAAELIGKTYKFYPGVPNPVNNPLLWTLDTVCKIESTEQSNQLNGVMRKKSASINDKHLKEGESTSVVVKNKDEIHIVADYGAIVEITNQGNSLVVAKCKI